MEDIIDGLSLDEVELVFYDNTDKLWKYFDAQESTNEVGNQQVNCNWCSFNTNGNNDNVYTYSNSSDSITRGLYDLDIDINESVNLFDVDDLSMDIQKTLKPTVTNNILQYFSNEHSESSVYLYGNFDCFYDKHHAQFPQAWPIYFCNLWTPFLESEFDDKISTHYGFDTTRMMYKLHTTHFSLSLDIQQLRDKLAVVKPLGRENHITRDNRELIDEEMLNIGIQLFPDMYNQFDGTFDCGSGSKLTSMYTCAQIHQQQKLYHATSDLEVSDLQLHYQNKWFSAIDSIDEGNKYYDAFFDNSVAYSVADLADYHTIWQEIGTDIFYLKWQIKSDTDESADDEGKYYYSLITHNGNSAHCGGASSESPHKIISDTFTGLDESIADDKVNFIE